jgi:hypothetical protein
MTDNLTSTPYDAGWRHAWALCQVQGGHRMTIEQGGQGFSYVREAGQTIGTVRREGRAWVARNVDGRIVSASQVTKLDAALTLKEVA